MNQEQYAAVTENQVCVKFKKKRKTFETPISQRARGFLRTIMGQN